MKPSALCRPLLVLIALAASAVAQKPSTPPSKPSKPNDAAALEEAIRAVDRATGKTGTTPGKGTSPSSTPPDTTPRGQNTRPSASAKERPDARPSPPEPSTPLPTIITSLDDAELDKVNNTITYYKNVFVDRPDFKIWCDRLEFTLNKTAPKEQPPASANGKAAPEPDQFSAGLIKTATATSAEGGMVVIWRKTSAGDTVSIGRRAVYTASNGTFTITGLPEVLTDMTYYVHAAKETDSIILLKNGNARSRGGTTEYISNRSRAREVRLRLFSHVPGKRPAQALPPDEVASGPAAPSAAPDPPPAQPQ